MTNQEAREILTNLEADYRDLDPLVLTNDSIQLVNERIEALGAAISALQAQDLQPTCNNFATDVISRKAAIDEWKNDFKGYVNALNIPRDDYNGIMAYIDELPSAQPDRCDTCRFVYYPKEPDNDK